MPQQKLLRFAVGDIFAVRLRHIGHGHFAAVVGLDLVVGKCPVLRVGDKAAVFASMSR
jgi:hypothetical protein